jgi:hypothetical protein
VNRNNYNFGTASCLAGERATGGGVQPVSNVYFPRVIGSFAQPATNGTTPTGWAVWVANDDTGGFNAPATVTVRAYVICAAP